MTCTVWWIRRDLRLVDNLALSSALKDGGQVVPLFILDPRLLESPYVGNKRKAFLFDSLRALDADLRKIGSYLVIRRGDPVSELGRLMEECQAQEIYAQPDYSPYAQKRDEKVSMSLPVRWVGCPAVHPPGTVLKSDATPYTVYTPFSKAWKALPIPKPGGRFYSPEFIPTPVGLKSISLPSRPALSTSVPFPAGEAEAHRRLVRFTSGILEHSGRDLKPIYRYASGRDRLDQEGTSQLSPYLRFGMLSPRQTVAAAMGAIQAAPDPISQKGAQIWLNELIWREFYIHILYHFPRVRRENFRLPGIQWVQNREHFDAWCQGSTGYPVVDVAMRQLSRSGWMHNRSRMIVASFLTKDLLIDWRWGERWFMEHLVDGDPAANNGGWQWTAGTGTDAAPYFRIFNPVTQSKRHDPQGVYIRRWLPELSRVPDEFIHEPWKMPRDVQRSAGCLIGEDYPAPIIDHAWARERALRVFAQAKA